MRCCRPKRRARNFIEPQIEPAGRSAARFFYEKTAVTITVTAENHSRYNGVSWIQDLELVWEPERLAALWRARLYLHRCSWHSPQRMERLLLS